MTSAAETHLPLVAGHFGKDGAQNRRKPYSPEALTPQSGPRSKYKRKMAPPATNRSDALYRCKRRGNAAKEESAYTKAQMKILSLQTYAARPQALNCRRFWSL